MIRMTEKRLNIDLIEDLFVREELIRLYEENEQLKQYNTELINKIDFLERVIDGDV